MFDFRRAFLFSSSATLLGAAFCVLVAGLLVVMPIIRLETLHSNFYDLGQYATYHHAIATDGYWASLLRSHAHLLAVPSVLIYGRLPGNLTLILLQSAIVVASAGLYAIYWSQLKLPAPLAGASLYLLSFPVWFAALFDFHFEHLVFPLIIGFFLVIERSDLRSRRWLAVGIGLLLCLVKESYPLSAAMLGLYLIFAKRWLAAGLVLAGLSLIYFFVVTMYLIPHFSNGAQTGELWSSAFGHLGNSTAEIAGNVLARPWTIVWDMLFTPRKLLYVLGLFGALAFLPLFRPLTLLAAVPPLGISLLSHNVNHYYLGHQYTAVVMVTLLVAAAQALTKWKRRAQISWIVAMLVTSVVSQVAFGPSPISRLFWSPNIFNYHWTAYRSDAHDRLLKAAIARFVPADDAMVVSTQNAINEDRLTDRRAAYAYPAGVFSPVQFDEQTSKSLGRASRAVWADYVVLDRRRPLSFGDEICTFDREHVCKDEAFVARFDALLKRLKQEFTIMYDEDGIIIAKRLSLPPTDR